jgi:hypothetical protein
MFRREVAAGSDQNFPVLVGGNPWFWRAAVGRKEGQCPHPETQELGHLDRPLVDVTTGRCQMPAPLFLLTGINWWS